MGENRALAAAIFVGVAIIGLLLGFFVVGPLVNGCPIGTMPDQCEVYQGR